MRRAARTDANHAAIRDALRKAGRPVKDLSHVGGGVPDLLTMATDGRLVFIEVKNPKMVPSARKLTAHEQRFADKFPVSVVLTVDDALRAVGLNVEESAQ